MDCEDRKKKKGGEKEMEDGRQIKLLPRKGSNILCLSWIAPSQKSVSVPIISTSTRETKLWLFFDFRK